MKADDQHAWQNAVLDEIFVGIAADPVLTQYLVFKGARVLARHLPESARQSLDLDANLCEDFLAAFPKQKERADFLEEHLRRALHRHFEAAPIVHYEIEDVRIEALPRDGHPFGWDALRVTLRVRDLASPGIRGLPTLTLDLAAPEWLSEHSTTKVDVGGRPVTAYTLERIAGEKLRAFLSTTPAHRTKVGGYAVALRVKDLADLHRIATRVPLTDTAFWHVAGAEFRGACESRSVDCAGWETFAEVEDLARGTYAREPTLAREVPFADAWHTVHAIVQRFTEDGVTPFRFPVPVRRTPE